MWLTIEEVQAYLGIDVADDEIQLNITRLISAAERYLASAVGANFNRFDERAKELGLMIIADCYDNREYSGKVQSAVSRITASMITQLRLETGAADDEV